MSNNKSITAKNIPKALLDRKVAKEHFSQFGRITKFVTFPRRHSCIIEYEKNQSAEQALHYGKIYDEDTFEIEFTRETESRSLDTQQEYDMMDGFPMMKPTPLAGIYELPQRREMSILTGRGTRIAEPQQQQQILSPVQVPVPATIRNEYETIMKKPAYTAEEKYRVLDARDKLLRLTLEKTTDIRKAKRSVGVCPDMCPEKERLMREFQHQVAVFELDLDHDEMDHSIAVKQYSRSSADQESPLSHELRPEPVLQLTMTYLLRETIDLCDDPNVNISDWFHFVWDRTRSIRKDITQQELCSLAAVELVEQCARFHIHCAGRLVAEDISVFDPKINTENLTKCLQSLKYMYHDLSLKNVKCPCEKEFRGYIILLNMNDSNFLWEIKQLDEEIKKSIEVRFAIDAYLAMDNSNYVRFFNLVRNTTYMNACILLRYFNQVRIKAVNILLKSYTHRTPISFEIDYLMEILGFEDMTATTLFLEYYGFPCHGNRVNLDRKYFDMPDIPFVMDRAFRMVESKRTTSAGEIICGKKIPSLASFGPYKPHNSFDENGYLKNVAWRADDQNYFKKRDGIAPELNVDTNFAVPLPSPKSSPKTSPRVSPKPFGGNQQSMANFKFSLPTPTTVTTSEELKPSSIFGNSNFTLNRNLFKPPSQQPSTFSLNFGRFPTITSGVTSTTSSPFFETAMKKSSLVDPDNDEEVDEEDDGDNQIGYDDENEEQSDEYEEADEERVDDEDVIDEEDTEDDRDSQDYGYEGVGDEVDEPTPTEILPPRKSVETIYTEAATICDDIIRAVVEERVKLISSDELWTIETILEKSETINSNLFTSIVSDLITTIVQDEIIINYIKTYRYFLRWRTKVRNIIKKRETIANVPIWLPTQKITAKEITINNRDFVGYEKDKKFLDNYTITRKKIDDNILKNVERYLLTDHTKSQKFLKFVISIPDERESKFFPSFIEKLLQTIFTLITDHSSEYLYFNYKIVNNSKIFICVRKVRGEELRNEEQSIDVKIADDMNGLIFFISESQNMITAKRRLTNILLKSDFVYPVPLNVIACNTNTNKSEIFDGLALQDFIDDNILDRGTIVIETVKYLNNQIEPIYEVLETRMTELVRVMDLSLFASLEMEKTITFFENNLGDQLWKRFDKVVDKYPSILKATTDFNFIVALYNHTVAQLITIVDHNFDNYPKLPAEFSEIIRNNPVKYEIALSYEYFPENWKDSERQNRLKEFLSTLKLKNINGDRFKDYSSICDEILDYLSKLLVDDSHRTRTFNRIVKYLTISLEYNPNVENLSWMGIVKIIAISLMYDRFMIIDQKADDQLPEEIIYNKSELNLFTNTNLIYTQELINYINELDAEKLSSPIVKRRKFL